jgi:phage repressor protein C with HTH and peptisase S24 domain
MMPVLPPDTLIWGIRWFNRLKVGQIVIFVHDGKERIKRIDKIKDDKLFLISDNASAGKDSRHFGWIALGQVKARVIWPHAPKDRAETV